MLVRRFYDDRLAQAAYLIGCQRTGEAMVIDPPRDIAPLLAAAKQEGMMITKVSETHIHADFVSGSRELARATGAQLLLSKEGTHDWQYGFADDPNTTLIGDRDQVTLGGISLEVRHTPGHTPEHIVFVVTDTARSQEPVAMVSGDFIFVGDVGRPDLLEKAAKIEGTMAAGAKELFASLQSIADLPDHLQIWPGHGAGSACGKALGSMPSSTLGYERRTNWAFAGETEAEFIATVLEGQPNPPTYFARMKQVNRDGPPVLGQTGPLPILQIDDFARVLTEGVVLDIRPKGVWAAGHLSGTINIPLIKSFTTWSGWLLPYDRPISLVSDSDASTAEARRALSSIGLDNVAGVFQPGLLENAATAGELKTTRNGKISEAATLIAAGRTVVDLRELSEWRSGHIPGAQHHPLGTVTKTFDQLDRSTPLGVHCQGGTRSAIGVSVLEAMGFSDVLDLSDGYRAWQGTDEEVAE